MENKNEKRDLMIFENQDFGTIRTISIDGEPWLVGKDVAVALGYKNSRDAFAKHVDDEDKGVAKCDTPGGRQDLTIINESGLYSLIFSSQLPDAKKFKRWVTSEVLPAIRKTGMYSIQQDISTTRAIQRIDDCFEQLECCNKRLENIEKATSYSNYYLRLQMRSGYDERWERCQGKNIKNVAEFIGTDSKRLLKEVYREMEHRYGIDLNAFISDYKRTKNVSTCSTLSVISFSFTLREMFDAILNEVMGICKIDPTDPYGYGGSHLMEMVESAVIKQTNGSDD